MTETILRVSLFAYAPLFGTIVILKILDRFVYRESKHRSPLPGGNLRYPGYTLERKLEDLRENLDGYLLGLILAPLLTIAFSFALLANQQLPYGTLHGFFAFCFIGVGYCSWKIVTLGSSIRNCRKGMEGERAVGWALDRLMAEGFIVYHDLPGANFNIDHVVIGKSGVFTIETKYRSKHEDKDNESIKWDGVTLEVAGWVDDKTIPQVREQTEWIEKYLSERTAQEIPVRSVVAFPGWYTEYAKGCGNIWVGTDALMINQIRKETKRRLDEKQVKQIALLIEDRCRFEKSE